MTEEETTKTRFRDFGSGKPVEQEPLTFRLLDEDFEALPALPGKAIIDLVRRARKADEVDSLEQILDFFKLALKDESYERFSVLIEDRERVVSVDTLASIVEWLMETYGERPEEPSEA